MREFLKKYFSRKEAQCLLSCLLFAIFFVVILGKHTASITASVVIAYFLNKINSQIINKFSLSYKRVFYFTFLSLISFIIISLFYLFPLIYQQILSLLNNAPHFVEKFNNFITAKLAGHLIKPEVLIPVQGLLNQVTQSIGKFILNLSVSSIQNIVSCLIYFFLVPILVFFILKDKVQIITWGRRFFSQEQTVHHNLLAIWQEIDAKIGSYVIGKFIEIVLVSTVSFFLLTIFNVNYALTLALVIGFSSIIPYLGVVIATIPLLLVSTSAFGFSAHFYYLMITYAIIMFIDANILVPILFADRLHIHSSAIIISLILCGSLFGFWGVFFAIPIATTCSTLINKWPKK